MILEPSGPEPIQLPTLYSRTNTGAIQTWTIEVLGDLFRTVHGQLDGKLQITEWTKAKPKNGGKTNATCGATQALKEAQALHKKKKETGYFEELGAVDDACWQEPMRANDYHKVKAKDKKGFLKYPLAVQPKLDGHRCIINKDGAWTRKGKRHMCTPHIEAALKHLFDEDPNLVLDGELYADKYANDFNELSSIIRSQKPTVEDLDKSAEFMQYWIYDIADPVLPFFERNTKLNKLLIRPAIETKCIKVVATFFVESDHELVKYYEEFIDNNYEGMMVRTNTEYEFKRTNALLKYKSFQDEEFTAIGYIEGEGNRTGTIAVLEFLNEDGEYFKADMMGNRDYCRQLFNEKDKIKGTRWTVKFFNRTPVKNVPRFGKVKALRYPWE